MPRVASAPDALLTGPFLGNAAIASGLLTGRQLQHRQWIRLYPDVYVHANVTLDHVTRCVAATLWLDGRGVVSGTSAAQLLGAPQVSDGHTIEVTVPDRAAIRPRPGIALVRSTFVADDLIEQKPIVLTSRVRTAFDVARRLPRHDALVQLDALLRSRWARPEDVLAYARARPRWPGTGGLAALLGEVEPLTESPMETRMRLVIVDGGLPRPVPQFEVEHNGYFVGRVDLAYPERRLGLEYEGDHHRDRATFQRDLRRFNALRAAGWQILRFGPDEVLRRPAHLVAQVRRALGS